jgi:hypothetical protein
MPQSASYDAVSIPSFMTISSSIQVILRLLPQQLQRLQCWYYSWEGFMKYAVEMTSGGTIHISSSMKICSGVQKSLGPMHIQTQDKPTFIFQNTEIRLKYISKCRAGYPHVIARLHESEYTAVTGQGQLNWQHIWSSH